MYFLSNDGTSLIKQEAYKKLLQKCSNSYIQLVNQNGNNFYLKNTLKLTSWTFTKSFR